MPSTNVAQTILLQEANKMLALCGGCGYQMTPQRVLAIVLCGQYPDNSPYGIVEFLCTHGVDCGTSAHVEVDIR